MPAPAIAAASPRRIHASLPRNNRALQNRYAQTGQGGNAKVRDQNEPAVLPGFDQWQVFHNPVDGLNAEAIAIAPSVIAIKNQTKRRGR